MSRPRRHAPDPAQRLQHDDEDVTSLLNGALLSPPPTTPPPSRHAVHITSSPLTIAHFESPRHPSSPPLSPPPYSHPPPSPYTPSSPHPPLLLTALTHWRLSLLSQHLHRWRLSTRLALSYRLRLALLSLLFRRWRHHSAQAKAHRQLTLSALQHWALSTQRRAFHRWVVGVRSPAATAEEWRAERLYRRVLQGWAEYSRRRRRLYAVAHHVVDLGESRCLQDAFTVWHVQAHTLHLATAAHVTRALTQALHTWRAVTQREAQRRLLYQASEGAQVASLVRCERCAIQWWTEWVRRARLRQEKQQEVARWWLQRWMRQWKRKVPSLPSQRSRALTDRAVVHRSTSHQRRFFMAWRSFSVDLHSRAASLRKVEDDKWLGAAWVTWRGVWERVHRRRREEEQRAAYEWARRETRDLSTVFTHWLARSQEAQQHRQDTALAVGHHRTYHLRSSVFHWAVLTTEQVKARRQWSAAVEHERRRVVNAVWSRWKSRAHQRRAIQRLAQSVHIDRMRRVMRSWQAQVYDNKATTFLQRQQRHTLSSAVGAWHNVAQASAGLRTREATVTQSVNRQLTTASFSRWRSSFFIHRHRRLSILRLSLHAWREVQRRHREERRATTTAWTAWREAVRLSREQSQQALAHYRRLTLHPAISALHQHCLYRRDLRWKEQLATDHYQQRLASSHPTPFLRTAYLAWFYFTRHRRVLTRSSAVVAAQRDQALTREAFSLWLQQAAPLSAASNWRMRRSASDAVRQWREGIRMEKETEEMAAVSTRVRAEGMRRRAKASVTEWWEWAAHRRLDRHEKRLAHLFHVRALFISWRNTVPAQPHRMQAKQRRAQNHHDTHLQRQAATAWRRAAGEIIIERQRAEELWREQRAVFMKQRAMGQWKRRLAAVKEWATVADHHNGKREVQDLRRVFDRWRAVSLQVRADLAAVQRGQVHHRRCHLHAACVRWQAVTLAQADQRLRSSRVQSRQSQGLLSAALSLWAHRAQQCRAASVLSAYTVRLQQRAALEQWKDAALNTRAVDHAERLSAHLLVTALYQWHHHAQSQRGERSCTLTVVALSHRHLLSNALNIWMTALHHHRRSSHLAAVIGTAHQSRLVKSVWAAWREAKQTARQVRLMHLARWWLRWKVELKVSRVDRRALTHAVRAWKAVGSAERKREEASRAALAVKVQREAMRRWRERGLTHRILRHWRQQTAHRLVLALHLTTAEHHLRLTCTRRAVQSLRFHSHRAKTRKGLLAEVARHAEQRLLSHVMGQWRERAQQSRALKVISRRAEAHVCEAALSRWQEVTWDDRAVHFHQATLRQQAVLALYLWANRRRQIKADEALVDRVQRERTYLLVGDAFCVWLHSFRCSVHLQEEELRVEGMYHRRLAHAVLLFWFNASVVHRHFRLRALGAAWREWTGRLRVIEERRQVQRQALLAWKEEAKRSVEAQRGLVLHRRRRQLSLALHALRGFSQRRKVRKTQRSQALAWERLRQQRKVWSQWTQQQRTAQLSKAQLALAAQYHTSVRCTAALHTWKRRLDSDRQSGAAVAALQTSQLERRKRGAIVRWQTGTQLRGRVQRLHRRTSQAVLASWRSLTIACTRDKARLLAEAWRTWRTAAKDASQWRTAVEHRRLRESAFLTRLLRGWRTQHGHHTTTLAVGDRLREETRRRCTLEVWLIWRQSTETVQGRVLPMEKRAVAFHQRRLGYAALLVWRSSWDERRVRAAEMEKAAVHWCELTLKRRLLDLWEERTSERMKSRHLQSTQAVRIRIAMRAYHTSLLLHTFSQWRAAAAALQDQRPSSSPFLSSASTSQLRLTSLADLRRFIERQRAVGERTGLRSGGHSVPQTPLTSTSTESLSPSSGQSEAGVESRPSTVDSVGDRQGRGWGRAEAEVSRAGERQGLGLRVNSGRRGEVWSRAGQGTSAFPRVDMSDL